MLSKTRQLGWFTWVHWYGTQKAVTEASYILPDILEVK